MPEPGTACVFWVKEELTNRDGFWEGGTFTEDADEPWLADRVQGNCSDDVRYTAAQVSHWMLIEHLSMDNVILDVIRAIPQQAQRQYGTDEQLRLVMAAANKLGLYDAADMIRQLTGDDELAN